MVALVAIALLVLDLGAVARSRDATRSDFRPTQGAGQATESLDQQLDRVMRVVEDLRGLRFPGPPLVSNRSPDEVRAAIEEEFAGYTDEDAAMDEALLVALGQIDPSLDLRATLLTAYGDQVAGYYDPSTAELVVRTESDGGRLGRLDELTLAHELGHALVDAAVGLPDLEAFDDDDGDALLASQALIEGDATALMNTYGSVAMSALDQMFLAREALDLVETLESFQALPHVLRRSLEFPYVEGLTFVEHLRRQGGWAAVDAAYERPPTTTVEILEPLLYGRLDAVPTSPFGDLSGWSVERTGSFGAYDLQVLLEAPGGQEHLGDARARSTARAWRGGAQRQWGRGDDTAIAFHVQVPNAPAMCEILERWYQTSFPAAEAVDAPAGADVAFVGVSQAMVLVCDGTEFRVGIAPDLATADRAIQSAPAS